LRRAEERRTLLRERYGFRCGYCGITESSAGALLTADHFQPRAHGGSDDLDNLVYCCHACNEFKGDYWQPDSPERVLHPLRDDVGAHLVETQDGVLRPLSETGTFHLRLLQLNRPPLVAYRLERGLLAAARMMGQLADRIAGLEQRVTDLTQEMARQRQRD